MNMKFSKIFLVIISFLLLILILSRVEGMEKVIDDTHADFFKVELPGIYKVFKKYGNFPKEDVLVNKLNVKDYKKIVFEFYEWTKRNLNPKYLPSEEIIQNSIYLIEAEYFEDEKEDIAYFGDIITIVNNNEVKIRIIQTGGFLGNIYFFINYPIDIKLTNEEVKKLIFSSIDSFLNNPERIKELISEISVDGEIFKINKVPIKKWEYQLQTFQGFLFKNIICFYFKKDAYIKDNWPVRAREPMLDEWFEYYKAN